MLICHKSTLCRCVFSSVSSGRDFEKRSFSISKRAFIQLFLGMTIKTDDILRYGPIGVAFMFYFDHKGGIIMSRYYYGNVK